MILRFMYLAFLSVAVFLSGCEQGGTVDEKIASARARNDGPAIWVVKDHDSTLYLFGTVHLLPEGLEWQRDDLKDAFDESGTIFFEIDTDTSAQLEASIFTQQQGFLQSGQRLSNRLDTYQLKLLDAAANNGNIRLETLDTMQPWLASEFLTVAAASNAGLSSALAADEALKSRAARLRKNIIYLDTAEGQIRITSDQPEFVQMLLLTDTLEGFGSLGDDLTQIAEAWSVGRTDYLTIKTTQAIAAKSSELYVSLLRERNRDWTDTFMRFLEGNETGFAAVGVAHLLGEHSVQNMLRDQGYTVSRYYAFQGENVIRTVFE